MAKSCTGYKVGGGAALATVGAWGGYNLGWWLNRDKNVLFLPFPGAPAIMAIVLGLTGLVAGWKLTPKVASCKVR